MPIQLLSLALALGLVAADFGATKARAAQDANADVAVQFFERTCLKHFRDPAALTIKLEKGGELYLPEMKGDMPRIYLGGGEGRVWLLKTDTGIFFLTLRNDGLCTVFARRADEIRVLENLDGLFKNQSFFSRRQVDSDHEGVMTRRFYELVPGGHDATPKMTEVMRMTASTTREDAAGYQAALSMTPPVSAKGE